MGREQWPLEVHNIDEVLSELESGNLTDRDLLTLILSELRLTNKLLEDALVFLEEIS